MRRLVVISTFQGVLLAGQIFSNCYLNNPWCRTVTLLGCGFSRTPPPPCLRVGVMQYLGLTLICGSRTCGVVSKVIHKELTIRGKTQQLQAQSPGHLTRWEGIEGFFYRDFQLASCQADRKQTVEVTDDMMNCSIWVTPSRVITLLSSFNRLIAAMLVTVIWGLCQQLAFAAICTGCVCCRISVSLPLYAMRGKMQTDLLKDWSTSCLSVLQCNPRRWYLSAQRPSIQRNRES